MSEQLDRVLAAATWRTRAASRDLASYAETWRENSFARYRPSSADLSESQVHRFSTLWQRAAAKVEQVAPSSILRVGADNPQDAAELAELADEAGVRIAVHIDESTPTATWSWPLRVGVVAGASVTADVLAGYPMLSRIVVMDGRRDANVDVLVVPGAAARADLASRNIQAGLTIVDAADVTRSDEIRGQFGSFAALFLPAGTGRSWWRDMVTELSHDAPLDVAARAIPGSILVSDPNGLRLTSVRTYVATMLGDSPGVRVLRRPPVVAPEALTTILGTMEFDHEDVGATAVANAITQMSDSLPVTIETTLPANGPVMAVPGGISAPVVIGPSTPGRIEPPPSAPIRPPTRAPAGATPQGPIRTAFPGVGSPVPPATGAIPPGPPLAHGVDIEGPGAVTSGDLGADLGAEAMPAPEPVAEPAPEPVAGGGGRPPDALGPAEPGRAWPRLDAPDEVPAGGEFDVIVGLRGDPDPRVHSVIAGQLPNNIDVQVMVVVDGFELKAGELAFTVNLSREPARTLTLRAVDDRSLRAERRIGAQYTVGSELRAYAMRDILVTGAVRAAADTVESEPAGPPLSEPLLGADTAPTTLELTLQQGADLAGYVWLWRATSGSVALPATEPDELRTTLDQTAKELQQALVREGSLSNGTTLYDRLVSTGRHLADKLPDAIVDALRAAARAAYPQKPSVLLLSAEARIPWELAVIEPPISKSDSPFLCAQVHMGRWLIGAKGKPAAKPNPVKDDRSRAVIVGDYSELLTWRQLNAADTEADALIEAGATALAAEYAPVRAAVRGTPPVDVLHFAMHGKFSEGTREDGLVLVDRSSGIATERFFTPGDVGGGALQATAPFVFLNACQAGAAQNLLGDYAGLAAEFLRIGATAVIAPLWEVDDGIAAQAAQAFYAATDHGTTVGAAVSALRGKFTEATAEAADTAKYGSYLAYQYFGHPNLTLRKTQSP